MKDALLTRDGLLWYGSCFLARVEHFPKMDSWVKALFNIRKQGSIPTLYVLLEHQLEKSQFHYVKHQTESKMILEACLD